MGAGSMGLYAVLLNIFCAAGSQNLSSDSLMKHSEDLDFLAVEWHMFSFSGFPGSYYIASKPKKCIPFSRGLSTA